MIKYLFILAIFSPFKNAVFGQDSIYTQLIDSSIKYSGLFIGAHTSKNIRLDIGDTAYYKETLQNDYKYAVETKLLIELINNSKNIDTSYWTDADLKKSIIVKSRDEFIRPKDVIKKFNLVEKKEIKKYRRQINEFNNTNSWDKNIYYFSRPVFDNSKQFALIQFDNGHSGLGGGGAVTLFHFTEGSWKTIGDITAWKH